MSETLEAPAQEAPDAAGDDLDSVLRAAYKEHTPVEASRDDRGRFASQRDDTAADTPAVEKDDQPVADAAPEAPASWSDEAKGQWATLSPAVRDHIVQQDKERAEALRARDEESKGLNPIKEVLEPYRQKHAMAGVSDAEAVRRLLTAQEMLERDFDKAWPELVRAFGRDPAQVAQAMLGSQVQGGAAQFQAVQDPRVDRIEADLAARDRQATLSQIEAFAKDPANPHFDAARVMMGNLIAANPALTLREAYDKAIWADDTIREKLIAERTAKAEAERTTKAKAEAEKRKAASASVRNTPSGAGAVARADSGSIEDDLRAAIAELSN